MASKYSVIIFRLVEETEEGQFEEVKRFNETSLDTAKSVFNHQIHQLSWSLQHKLNMGVYKDDRGIVQLFDHREGFELAEEAF